MKIGIHKDPYGKFCPFLETYETILDYNGIEHIRLDASEPDFWNLVSDLDLFIFRWQHIDDHHQMAKTLLPIIEKEMGVKCFPNLATCWHYDDKIRQYYLLLQNGFPVIETWIFWDRRQASEWIKTAVFPLVFKLKGGASSNNVILIRSQKQASKLINRMFGKGIKSGHIPDFNNIRFKYLNPYKTIHRWGGNIFRKIKKEDISPFWQLHKNYALFQKFLTNNSYDTRVTIIGNKAFAFRRFTRRRDFRASGSDIVDMDISKIDLEFVKIGYEISQKFGFQSMAYDFIYNEQNNAELIEMSYSFPESRAFSTGYWDHNFKWHHGHFCPQYFQLADALNLPDLKLPK